MVVLLSSAKRQLLALVCLFVLSASAYGQSGELVLRLLGTYQSLVFDEGAAEIVTFFISNANANSITVLDISNPTIPKKINEIDLSPYGAGNLATGIYFYKIETDEFVQIRKMLLTK